MKRSGRGRQQQNQRKCAVATKDNGDIVGQHHAQQLDLLGSIYNEAPQAVWQSAATRALEVNALLMAAVVGEQRRVEQDRNSIDRDDVEMDTEEDDVDRPAVDESNDFDESNEESAGKDEDDDDEEDDADDDDAEGGEEDDSAPRGRSRQPASRKK